MCRRIAVVSGKGGVGKSTVAAGIAYSLSKMGRRVLLVDCDVCADSQKIFFKIETETVFNLGDLMADRCSLRSVITTPKDVAVDIITPPANFKDVNFNTFFKNLMVELETVYDNIIIDAPAGMDSGYSLATDGADSALVVTVANEPAIAFAEKVADDLRNKGIPACLVVNKIKRRKERTEDTDLDAISDRISLRLIGALPMFAPNTLKNTDAIAQNKMVLGYFSRISSRLLGKYVKIGLPADY